MVSLDEQIAGAKLFMQSNRKWRYIDRQFPAYALSLDLRDTMEAALSVPEMQELLLQLPQETLFGVYDMYPGHLLQKFEGTMTVAWVLATIICGYIAHQVAPEWKLLPVSSWNEFKERKERGWW